jgi:GntR family negative regulator for fad regulon and positive regulator of fabA
LDESPKAFTHFDWALQHELVLLSENPVFIMILNGFENLFLNLAPYYFSIPEARQHSQQYYTDLSEAAVKKDIDRAKNLTENIMRESLSFWQQTKLL